MAEGRAGAVCPGGHGRGPRDTRLTHEGQCFCAVTQRNASCDTAFHHDLDCAAPEPGRDLVVRRNAQAARREGSLSTKDSLSARAGFQEGRSRSCNAPLGTRDAERGASVLGEVAAGSKLYCAYAALFQTRKSLPAGPKGKDRETICGAKRANRPASSGESSAGSSGEPSAALRRRVRGDSAGLRGARLDCERPLSLWSGAKLAGEGRGDDGAFPR